VEAVYLCSLFSKWTGPRFLSSTATEVAWLPEREIGEQLEVPAGGEAPIEFRSAGELAAAMPVGGQVELVGALNWMIRSAGLVSWEDLFDGHGDPRDFDDVVRRAVGLGLMGR
jgi:hypothetical protein